MCSKPLLRSRAYGDCASFVARGWAKKASAAANCASMRSRSMPWFTTVKKPTLVAASHSAAVTAASPSGWRRSITGTPYPVAAFAPTPLDLSERSRATSERPWSTSSGIARRERRERRRDGRGEGGARGARPFASAKRMMCRGCATRAKPTSLSSTFSRVVSRIVPRGRFSAEGAVMLSRHFTELMTTPPGKTHVHG